MSTKQRSKYHPAENPPTVAAAIAGVIVAFGTWGLDSVAWPTQVEVALGVLILVVAGACGTVAQRWTKRVYYGPPPAADHAPAPGPALNRSGTKAAWD